MARTITITVQREVIDRQELVVRSIVKYALDIFYSFNEKEYDERTIFNINSVHFPVKELLPLKDDIEKFILYTCYFGQKSIEFKHVLRAMVVYGVSTYKPNMANSCPDKIDMEVVREYCQGMLELFEEEKKQDEKQYEETEESLYSHPIETEETHG